MSAPNIEMIAKSLRNFSLSERRRSTVRSPPMRSPPRRREESVELTVEINSEVALPCDWEQCLDMRTGQVYYRNWTTGKRTSEDPRLISNNSNYYASSSSDDDDDDSSNEVNRDKYFSGEFSSSSSSSSYEISSAEVNSVDPQVLVAAGCQFCFMFFMVPKHDFSCPKCSRLLLHLG